MDVNEELIFLGKFKKNNLGGGGSGMGCRGEGSAWGGSGWM